MAFTARYKHGKCLVVILLSRNHGPFYTNMASLQLHIHAGQAIIGIRLSC